MYHHHVMAHQAFNDIKNDIHHIFQDTRRLTEDSLALLSNAEHLEKTCKKHWKELVLDFLCSLCSLCMPLNEIRNPEVDRHQPTQL